MAWQEKALGVLVPAAGHEPRGAQVGKRPLAPGLDQELCVQQEQGRDCPSVLGTERPLEGCAQFWLLQESPGGAGACPGQGRELGRGWSPRSG